MTRTVKSLPIGALIVVPNSVHNGATPVFRKLADDHHASGTTLFDSRDILDIVGFDGKEPTNPTEDPNGFKSRAGSGNNLYKYSNIRQYLNSGGSNWFKKQHIYDEAPTSDKFRDGVDGYDKRVGFTSAFPQDFVNLVHNTTLTTGASEGDGLVATTHTDKFFLLSAKEMGDDGVFQKLDGNPISYYSTKETRMKKPTRQAVERSEYTKENISPSTAWSYITRSSYNMPARGAMIVIFDHQYTDGRFQGRVANSNGLGISPAFNLPSDATVTSQPNAQGYYEIVLAKPITLQLNTPDGQTFFEGDNLVIDGKAHSPNKGDVVIIKARLADSGIINLSTQVSDGEPFNFSQTLVFKQGRFMQGNTPVTGVLKEGDSYSLQVWAEDNKGAKSNVEKRTFGSIPNRPPIVNVTKTPSFTNASRTQIMSIEGTATDPDGDKVTVTIKHDSKPIITLPLANSKWSHTFLPGDLNVGANTFVITATDDKGLSHTKTVRINNKKYVSDMTHVPLVSLLDVDLEGVESDGGLLWIRRASDKTEYSARISTTDKKDASFIVADKASHIVNGMPRDQFTGETGTKSNRVTFEVTAKGAGSVTMIQGVVK